MDMRKGIEKAALSIRMLAVDAVQKAKSGHPGLPMGLAEFGALLYGEVLKHNPADPQWKDRDRFVLSAGHGSMLIYSLLYLSGYDVPFEDLKNFRQLGSKCAGHPEYGRLPGIETTTGPLGQGIANAVGMAMAERMLAERFNTAEHAIVDHHTFVIAGDGCMMEGVSSEACSLAGHLKLGKLIAMYDSNKITIDGSTDLAFTEDVAKRFEAYHWQVLHADAYDLDGILKHIQTAKQETDKPTLIILKSIIGKGSPNMAGTHNVHGAPLGEEEIKATRRALGVAEDKDFYVDPDAVTYYKEKHEGWKTKTTEWEKMFSEWKQKNPELAKKWDAYWNNAADAIDSAVFPEYNVDDKVATRISNHQILNATAKAIENLIGGSADLAASNKTNLKDMGDFQANTPAGRNINFGVREHAMGSISNGIALHGGLRPFCATFFVFSDYMRPPIRLASIMGLPVIYIFTHDSIYVGEDGPTHQPVEQFAALRIIPGLDVWRPADAQENIEAWKEMIRKTTGPSMIGLTRQNLPVFKKESASWKHDYAKGAYIAQEAGGSPSMVIIATGSEVEVALNTRKELQDDSIRIISMPNRERFNAQPADFKNKLLPPGVPRVVIEAGVSAGWGVIAGENGLLCCIDQFGESGAYPVLAEHYGFTAKAIAGKIKKHFKK
ncbi:MAG: transketolase [Spirochaetales bacterium]|nr:transketolase [Spirochaetales bacterium]